jgi:hypothetical protein
MLAVYVTEVPEQIGLPLPVDIEIVGVTLVVLLIVTLLDVAVGVEAQPEFEVITQVTTSLLAREVLVKVAPIAVFVPFTLH